MITTQQDGPVCLVVLDRPESRNALTGAMLSSLAETMARLDSDPTVSVAILTGRDPAFCAGLDLKDLARTYQSAVGTRSPRDTPWRGLLPPTSVPIIGAINGAAVTGGLELALGCDFLIASERATFADTHARVGVMPGGGLTIRLPQLVGVDRARRMSLTGSFVDAATALRWGLVTEVVAHDALLDRARELAAAVSDVDPVALGEIRSMYDAFADRHDAEAYRDEAAWSRRWMEDRFDEAAFSARREGIIERGSAQQ
jgi:enoyl-CoA hydratase